MLLGVWGGCWGSVVGAKGKGTSVFIFCDICLESVIIIIAGIVIIIMGIVGVQLLD